jgi:hypothetical protein
MAANDEEEATAFEVGTFLDDHATAIVLIGTVIWWLVLGIIVGGQDRGRDDDGD